MKGMLKGEPPSRSCTIFQANARRQGLIGGQQGENLILGFWSKLPFGDLTTFLASLRHTAFEGDVCIYVDDVSVELVETLLAHGVIVERASSSGQLHMTALSSRFFNFLDFLAQHGHEYNNVMLTDLRDVIFQSDLFAAPLPADIVYAQERCRLGNSPVNRVWVVGVRRGGDAQHARLLCVMRGNNIRHDSRHHAVSHRHDA